MAINTESDASVSDIDVHAKSTRKQALKHHLFAEVRLDHTDVLILICCLISGLVDSSIYNAYGTFVSMQTGNTIFVGLGAATIHTTTKPYGWAKSLMSIVCFCLGCLFFSNLVRRLGSPRRRFSLSASFFLQSIMLLTAAAIVQARVVNGELRHLPHDIDWRTLVPVALLSFQAAGQIVASRSLALPEVPSVVLTTMLHDLMSDPTLLARPCNNVKRNRRATAFGLILLGAIMGGYISEQTGQVQLALWLAGGLKACLVLAWLSWPAACPEPV